MVLTGKAALVAVLFFCVHGLVLAASPGDIDETFGPYGNGSFGIESGIITTSWDLYVAPDDTFVISLTQLNDPDSTESRLIGFDREGNALASFGTGAQISSTDAGSVIADVNVSLLSGGSGGKMLVVSDRPATKDLVATLLNANGQPAGATHVIPVPINADENMFIFRVIRLDNGNHVVAGHNRTNATTLTDAWILGLGTDGTPGAIDFQQFDYEAKDYVYALEPANDGGFFVLVRSTSNVDGTVFSTVGKWTAGGAIDTSWGNAGEVQFSDTVDSSYFEQLQVLPDDSIRLYGGMGGGTKVVASLRADGTLDPAFGTGGFQQFSASETRFSDVIGFSDGSALLFGQLPDGLGDTDGTVLAINANGQLDTSFGTSGRARFSFANDDYPWRMQRQGSGKVVAIGDYYDDAGSLSGSGVSTMRFHDLLRDTLPAQFDFPAESGVSTNVLVTSAAIMIEGLGAGMKVPAYAENGEVMLSGSGEWETGIVYVANGDQVSVRHQSAASNGVETTTTLHIGGWLHDNREDIVGNHLQVKFISTTDSGGGGGGGSMFWLLLVAAGLSIRAGRITASA